MQHGISPAFAVSSTPPGGSWCPWSCVRIFDCYNFCLFIRLYAAQCFDLSYNILTHRSKSRAALLIVAMTTTPWIAWYCLLSTACTAIRQTRTIDWRVHKTLFNKIITVEIRPVIPFRKNDNSHMTVQELK